MQLEQLIKIASEYTGLDSAITTKDVMEYCKHTLSSIDDFANSFSKMIAERFYDNKYDYTFSDNAMNWLNIFMIGPMYAENGIDAMPEYAHRVYLAFDDGEWNHGDENINPVEEFTRPQIKEILDSC